MLEDEIYNQETSIPLTKKHRDLLMSPKYIQDFVNDKKELYCSNHIDQNNAAFSLSKLNETKNILLSKLTYLEKIIDYLRAVNGETKNEAIHFAVFTHTDNVRRELHAVDAIFEGIFSKYLYTLEKALKEPYTDPLRTQIRETTFNINYLIDTLQGERLEDLTEILVDQHLYFKRLVKGLEK